jgi:hypothetical protein
MPHTLRLRAAQVQAPGAAPAPGDVETTKDGDDRDDRRLGLEREERWVVHDQVHIGRDGHHPRRGEAREACQQAEAEERADDKLGRLHEPHIERMEGEASRDELAGERRAEFGDGKLHGASREEEQPQDDPDGSCIVAGSRLAGPGQQVMEDRGDPFLAPSCVEGTVAVFVARSLAVWCTLPPTVMHPV